MTTDPPLVCFISDFGLVDATVGTMKGVLLSLVPNARIVDLTHNIPAQNIRQGAFQLMCSAGYFPKGTFFICVVDPGVGSPRKIIYAEADGRRFVAPDNGLLSWHFLDHPPTLLADVSKGVLPGAEVSRTFHGRDIMVPVAGHLLQGHPVGSFAPSLSAWERLSFPTVKKTGSKWGGEVMALDGFGNLITNFRTKDVAPLASRSKVWIEFGETPTTIRGLVESYAEVEKGRLLVIGGSSGFLEIAVRDGSAAGKTGLRDGSPVSLNFYV